MKPLLYSAALFCLIFFMAAGLAKERPVVPIPFNPGRPLNSSSNDFSPALSPDGTFMVFNSKRGGQRYADIYITHYRNGTWTDPEPFRELNSPFNDDTPHISMNGELILFASDRDGSIEAGRDARGNIQVSFDIYWSKKSGGRWSPPVPVAGAVNTYFNERAPALSPDGKTIYFTRGIFGSSKSIIVQSSIEYDGFGKVTALPAPFNQGSKDVALIRAEEGFYFASNRDGGHGGFDVYFVSFKNGIFGKAINLGPLVNSASDEVYYSKSLDTAYFCSNRPGGEGLFDIYKASFDIHAIYFDYDSAVIKKESHKVLDSIYSFLKENKNIRFSIIGHTDLHGSHEYNNKLSLKRAEAVRDYLVKKGIDSSRLIVRGAGKTEPRINKEGPGFDEKNRRTEFKVLDLRD